MERGILKNYVLGFAFTENRQEVLLLKKARSRSGLEWMVGKYNGLGGMIHDGENPLIAMSREFQEESGVIVDPFDWQWAGKFFHPEEYKVTVFRLFSDKVRDAKTCSDEGEVELIRVADVPSIQHVKNLAWLIPLLLKEDLTGFVVEE